MPNFNKPLIASFLVVAISGVACGQQPKVTCNPDGSMNIDVGTVTSSDTRGNTVTAVVNGPINMSGGGFISVGSINGPANGQNVTGHVDGGIDMKLRSDGSTVAKISGKTYTCRPQ